MYFFGEYRPPAERTRWVQSQVKYLNYIQMLNRILGSGSPDLCGHGAGVSRGYAGQCVRPKKILLLVRN